MIPGWQHRIRKRSSVVLLQLPGVVWGASAATAPHPYRASAVAGPYLLPPTNRSSFSKCPHCWQYRMCTPSITMEAAFMCTAQMQWRRK